MAARNWYQPNGDAGNTSAADVLAVRGEPERAWTLSLGEIVSEPVAWGDLLLVITRESGNRTLHVRRIEDGEPVTRTNLGRGSEAWLGIWQGSVVVVEEEVVRTFTLMTDQLKRGKVLRGDYQPRACLEGEWLFAGGKDAFVHLVDVKRGRLLDSKKLGLCTPAFANGHVVSPRVVEGERGQPDALFLAQLKVTGSGTKTTLKKFVEDSGVVVDRYPEPGDYEDSYVIALTGAPATPSYGARPWFVRSPTPIDSPAGDDIFGALFPEGGLSRISTRPAVWNGELYGFDPDGTLIRQRSDGGYYDVVTLDQLPPGARPAPATIARGVAYLGNWAVELESQRVLWCDPDLKAEGALLPVADGRFVYWTEQDELVCCRDSQSATAIAAEASTGSLAVPAPTRPGSGDAVILADGTRIVGAVEIGEDYEVIVTPAGGEPRSFPENKVALLENGGEIEFVGEQFGVREAWARVLNVAALDLLEKQFRAYLKPRLLDECQRLLDEAAERGMDLASRRKLANELATKTKSTASNLERQRKSLEKKEEKAREKIVEEYLVASAWCLEQELPEAATALLADARALGVADEGILERASALVPEEFPWRSAEKAREMWLAWAVELLPAGATFIAPDDETWDELEGTVWRKKTLGLVTRNLRLLTRSTDPVVIGACLRNGEGAVRVLEELLGSAGTSMLNQRLDVRIHANREEYLDECTPAGTYAMPWSAGYYSPYERVSRFYVFDEKKLGAPITRELHKTLTHELTHQYLCQRWVTSNTVAVAEPMAPGFWVVEGFARFIEDQVVELGRTGSGLNDDTVKSVDASARLVEREALIPIKTLVEMTQIQFARIDDSETVDVRLTNTLQLARLDQRSIFYEEAGSLVFFLMNRQGEAGREKLIEYMKSYYLGNSERRGWKELGFKTSKLMEQAFLEFLGSVLFRTPEHLPPRRQIRVRLIPDGEGLVRHTAGADPLDQHGQDRGIALAEGAGDRRLPVDPQPTRLDLRGAEDLAMVVIGHLQEALIEDPGDGQEWLLRPAIEEVFAGEDLLVVVRDLQSDQGAVLRAPGQADQDQLALVDRALTQEAGDDDLAGRAGVLLAVEVELAIPVDIGARGLGEGLEGEGVHRVLERAHPIDHQQRTDQVVVTERPSRVRVLGEGVDVALLQHGVVRIRYQGERVHRSEDVEDVGLPALEVVALSVPGSDVLEVHLDLAVYEVTTDIGDRQHRRDPRSRVALGVDQEAPRFDDVGARGGRQQREQERDERREGEAAGGELADGCSHWRSPLVSGCLESGSVLTHQVGRQQFALGVLAHAEGQIGPTTVPDPLDENGEYHGVRNGNRH